MKTSSLLAAFCCATLCAVPAFADPPDKEHGHGHGQGHREDGAAAKFGDRDRAAIQAYFGGDHGAEGCPPGLAKKGNGCMPQGQAKKWAVGQPLPAGEPVYPLPPELVVQLTPPPSGYHYMRMAGDILMVAAGTNMVIDAIQDLGR